MLAGPIERQRKPARVVESRGVESWAAVVPAQSTAQARATRTGWAGWARMDLLSVGVVRVGNVTTCCGTKLIGTEIGTRWASRQSARKMIALILGSIG